MSFRFKSSIKDLQEKGCTDEDILNLMNTFDNQMEAINDVY